MESEEVDKRELQEMINEVAVVENVMIALPEPICVTTRKLLDTGYCGRTRPELLRQCGLLFVRHVMTDVFEGLCHRWSRLMTT